MKIELLVTEVVNGSVFEAGAVVEDADAKHAKRLIADGKAKAASAPKKDKEEK
jgi:hypothetical protein